VASDAYQTVLKLDKGSSEIYETRRFTKGEGNKKKDHNGKFCVTLRSKLGD
jgi:hypothetical protein